MQDKRQLWETGEVHAGYWWGDLSEVDHLEDLGVDCGLYVKWIFKK